MAHVFVRCFRYVRVNNGVKALVIKNNRNEGPGLIELLFREKGWTADTVELDSGEKIPEPASYSCVIVLGGPDSANDNSETMRSEIAFVRRVLDLGIPYLGICLGMQVLVKAAGGNVVASPEREIGWRDGREIPYHMLLTPEGRNDSLCTGLPDEILVFQLHGEMVVPTGNDRVLASGHACPVQMVREGICAYGIQGHVELTEGLLRGWLTTDADLSLMDSGAVIADYNRFKQEYLETGTRILSNFLDAAGRRQKK